MTIKRSLSYLWKLPLCGILFFIGMAISGVVLPLLGLEAPQSPAGTDPNTIALYFFGGSILLAFLLSFLSRNLSLKGLGRWLVLSCLIWIVGTAGMVLESAFFMDTDAVSSMTSTLFTLLSFLLPSISLAGAVSWLFPPAELQSRQVVELTPNSWTWNICLALLAYPLVYFLFGLLVQPWVSAYYSAGMNELTLPTWGQLIPLQLVRSALFLAVCLPVIRNWQGSRPALWLALAGSFFGLTAFMAVITAYWFPWQLRLAHGLELLADALVYSGALVWLWCPKLASIKRIATPRAV